MKFLERFRGGEDVDAKLSELTARKADLERRRKILEEDMAGPNGVAADADALGRIQRQLDEVNVEIDEAMRKKAA